MDESCTKSSKLKKYLYFSKPQTPIDILDNTKHKQPNVALNFIMIHESRMQWSSIDFPQYLLIIDGFWNAKHHNLRIVYCLPIYLQNENLLRHASINQ